MVGVYPNVRPTHALAVDALAIAAAIEISAALVRLWFFPESDVGFQGTTVAAVAGLGGGVAASYLTGLHHTVVEARPSSVGLRGILVGSATSVGVLLAGHFVWYRGTGRIALVMTAVVAALAVFEQRNPVQDRAKRLLDLLIASVGLAVFGVLFPVLYVAVVLESRGAFFFVQPRVGLGGREFRLFKVRTMRPAHAECLYPTAGIDTVADQGPAVGRNVDHVLQYPTQRRISGSQIRDREASDLPPGLSASPRRVNRASLGLGL